jgi:hypothetical protein
MSSEYGMFAGAARAVYIYLFYFHTSAEYPAERQSYALRFASADIRFVLP